MKTGILELIPSSTATEIAWDNKEYKSVDMNQALKWTFPNYSTLRRSHYHRSTYHFFLWGSITQMDFFNKDNLFYKYSQGMSEIETTGAIKSKEIRNEYVENYNNQKVVKEVEESEDVIINFRRIGADLSVEINDREFVLSLDNFSPEMHSSLDILKEVLDLLDNKRLAWNSNSHSSVSYYRYLNLDINVATWSDFVSYNKKELLWRFIVKTIFLQMDEWDCDNLIMEINPRKKLIRCSSNCKEYSYAIIAVIALISIVLLLIQFFFFNNKQLQFRRKRSEERRGLSNESNLQKEENISKFYELFSNEEDIKSFFNKLKK